MSRHASTPALEVALPLRLPALTYLPPHGQPPKLGMRVVVPFRNTVRVGLVVATFNAERPEALRHAIGYLDQEPFLDPERLSMLARAAEALFCPIGQVVADFLPFLAGPFEHRVRLVPGTRLENLPPEARPLAEWQAASRFSHKLLDGLREGGVLEEQVEEPTPEKTVLVPIKKPDDRLSPNAKAALMTLWSLGEVASQAELARRAGVGRHAIKTLLAKGYARIETRPLEFAPPAPPPKTLPAHDVEALPARVYGGRFWQRLAVLKGLAKRGPILVLFPEGALIERARPFFPEAIFLSGDLPPEARRRLWQVRGKSVFGTYQALFFPQDFSRIVVVEDASDNHKLRSGTHAFLPALLEALQIPFTSLSATPSAEALARKGPALALKTRPPRALVLKKDQRRGLLSGQTIAIIRQALEREHQVLVLAARRGYAARLHCQACDYEPGCPNCALPLRYHRRGKGGELVCHQCGFQKDAPERCPRCGSELLLARGPGLDWLAQALRRRFPAYPIGRLSADGEADTESLEEGRPGIIVATTRVLRRLPLPNLAVVAIPWVEGFAPESDFRAGERLFSLLWQLTDLHPRRNPLLVLEAYNPEHPAIKAFVAGDLESFPRKALEMRNALGYPPATRMVKLEYAHRHEAKALEAATGAQQTLAQIAEPTEVLGPAPAPVPRVKGRHIYHLILRAASHQRLKTLIAALPDPRPARLIIDPDPVSFAGALEP